MQTKDIQTMQKVPVAVADDLVKIIRLLAMIGRRLFVKHLAGPLDVAGWKRRESNEQIRKLMERIDLALKKEGARHTAGPLSRRLISQSLHESLSSVGDCCIFFLERMQQSATVATSVEALEFVRVIYDPLVQFRDDHQNRNERLFEEALQDLSAMDLKSAFQPVELGRSSVEVKLRREAIDLFNRIKYASKDENWAHCLKLITAYLIRHGDREENNREEVDQLIQGLQRREPGFQKMLDDKIATELFFLIQKSISSSDLKSTIRAIRKYAHIFQGNPDVKYFNEIDALEQKLYNIIGARDLWEELKS